MYCVVGMREGGVGGYEGRGGGVGGNEGWWGGGLSPKSCRPLKPIGLNVGDSADR